MSNTTAVQAIYLEREMLRVEFANSSIVLDHPAATGGGAKAPSPGHLLIGGMVAASLFSAMDTAKQRGLRLNSIVARSGWKAAREGKDGPLHALAFLERIWRNVEIEGDLGGISGADLIGRVGLLETLRNGLELTECVTFTESASPRGVAAPQNPDFLEYEKRVDGLAPGAKIDDQSPAAWQLSGTPLDNDAVMIEMPGLPLIVSRTGEAKRGPTPHELLLGGLAGCTAIYVGRNAPVHDIPLERVEVTAVAETPQDLSTPIRSIDKVTHIIGRLTEAEREKCAFFADFCALGETLKRGADIVDNLVAEDAPQARDTLSPFAHLSRSSQPPAECDDGACCVPARVPA
jgi:uncharacterized OsmC-like protein